MAIHVVCDLLNKLVYGIASNKAMNVFVYGISWPGL